MSKNAIKFHEDSWSSVAEATVATTPRMGGKKVQRTYSVCSVPSKKFVAKWLTVATLKGNVTTPLVEEVDGKYCLTTIGITELLNDLQTGMDVDFTGTNILVNFNKFINNMSRFIFDIASKQQKIEIEKYAQFTDFEKFFCTLRIAQQNSIPEVAK